MKYIITESQRHKLLMETISPTIRRRLNYDVSDIVVPLFTSMFPYEDEDENLDVVWDTKFDLHL